MNIDQVRRATALAKDHTVSLKDIDDSNLAGIALHGFQPTYATISQVARLMRDFIDIYTGEFDMEGINQIIEGGRHKVTIID